MVKKFLHGVLSILMIFILSGGSWGAPESNISGAKKNRIDIYGSIELWSSPGKITKVENISFDNMIKQIPMFAKPSSELIGGKITAEKVQQAAQAAQQAADCAQKAALAAQQIPEAAHAAKAAQIAADAVASASEAIISGKTTRQKEHILLDEPNKTLVEAKIDLVEISEIRVPYPDEKWIYQKEEKSRKLEYIEVEIISDDTKKTKSNYLVEKYKKIYCDRMIDAKQDTGPEEWEVPLRGLKNLTIEGYKDRNLEEKKKRRAEERKRMQNDSEPKKIDTSENTIPAA